MLGSVVLLPGAGKAQDAAHNMNALNPSLDTRLDAGEAESARINRDPSRRPWNEFDFGFATFRVNFDFLYDYSGFQQDDDNKDQLSLSPKADLRDLRFVFSGRFKFWPRASYALGYMYDKVLNAWGFRQTGLMIDVPELSGNLFIGRGKESFSTNRLMVGIEGFGMERAAINDAFLPILADGIKWTGSLADGKFVYNLGWYGDKLSENESFNKNDQQFIARGVWLPFTGTDRGLLHVALEARYGETNDGNLQYRSKPESAEATSYVIDTGKFPADHSSMLGLEAYYRTGSWLFGSEYFFNQVQSPEMHNPFFHGGEVFAAYILTGEERPYNLRGAFFEGISPSRSVFDYGPGAWEVVLRYSYADLDSELVHGGTFWRITPTLNWYLSDNFRVVLASGYSVLDRFGVRGSAAYFQTRLQLFL
jgi:phosphate-selective porin OprO/OprP